MTIVRLSPKDFLEKSKNVKTMVNGPFSWFDEDGIRYVLYNDVTKERIDEKYKGENA